MAIREGRWDCPYCKTTGILGREQHCPNCARSRPEGTKFYMPGQAPVVTDANLLQRAQVGPDWICEYCASSNPGDKTNCYNCNASREKTSPTQQIKQYGAGQAPQSGAADPAGLASPSAASRVAAGSNGRSWPQTIHLGPVAIPFSTLATVLALVIMFSVGSLFSALNNRGNVNYGSTFHKSYTFNHEKRVTVEAQITGFAWERHINIEAQSTVTEEDWSVPAGGRIVSQRQEIQRYEHQLTRTETRTRQVAVQVKTGDRTYVCGQKDLGNGFFEDVQCTEPVYETQYQTETYQEPIYEDVPIYGTKYRYEIDRWGFVRSLDASGSGRETYWPEVVLADKEREAGRSGSYTVTFTDAQGRTYSETVEESEWQSMVINGRYTLTVDLDGNILSRVSSEQ